MFAEKVENVDQKFAENFEEVSTAVENVGILEDRVKEMLDKMKEVLGNSSLR